MFKCDQCDSWKSHVEKQYVKKRHWANPKCVYQMCTVCIDAVNEQAEQFQAELELKREEVANGPN